MALFIGDDRVRESAERLAWLQGTTVDEAVRQALERALAEERVERERRLDQSLARLDAMPRRLYNEDLYDEFGNPR
jgi:hypothetical protein